MIMYEVWIHNNGEHVKLFESENIWEARHFKYSYRNHMLMSGERLTIRKVVTHE